MEYSRKYVKAALLAIAAEHPDRLNPTIDEGPGCAYNGDDGSHCIAGQFLANESFTDGDWVVSLPAPDVSRHGDTITLEGGYELANGLAYLGAPDVVVERTP